MAAVVRILWNASDGSARWADSCNWLAFIYTNHVVRPRTPKELSHKGRTVAFKVLSLARAGRRISQRQGDPRSGGG
jgi:hypothetical protein